MISHLQALVHLLGADCGRVREQGQQHTVMFCGDGLNDLAALGTAEVGMAIGPIDAMAAAPFSTRHSSIAGEPVSCSFCLLAACHRLQHCLCITLVYEGSAISSCQNALRHLCTVLPRSLRQADAMLRLRVWDQYAFPYVPCIPHGNSFALSCMQLNAVGLAASSAAEVMVAVVACRDTDID